ncbi:unnamed protein product [Haemonchus placei]|uniref:TPM_phosphatase domain-containing protein n=1 Tax=Haemonchus placei TaxID=6290 RepID=A0A158QJT0_HAEPC|nr:unnamed protein product [Haemonchus placei]
MLLLILTVGVIHVVLSNSIISSTFDDYTPETFPDSIEQPIACSMRVASFLCDPSEVLNEENITANHLRLSKSLIEVRELTKCTCSPMDVGECDDSPRGFTISAAVVKKMVLLDDQRNPAMAQLAAETFAETLRQRQNRGQCDDDVLIFVSALDEVVWTSLGSVTKRYLSDDAVKAITSRAESHFKNGDFTGGLQYMIDSYTTLLRGLPLDLSNGWELPIPMWSVIAISALLVILLLTFVAFMLYRCIIYCKGDRRAEYTMGTRM